MKTGYWYIGAFPMQSRQVGSLRFMPAQPAENWKGVLDASSFGATCPQAKKYKSSDENCLSLNIWTPAADHKKRPVFFYIHGGSFCAGAGSASEYNGSNLAKNGDVVVVTINYRLGALGFLDFSFLGEEFSPNCGLSDIVMALQWVYNNIGAFGGDPQSITVLGQSAGAIAASVLPVMPTARKYVSKVIMMSGGPSLLYTKQQYQEVARKFMQFMGIKTARQLKDMDVRELVSKQRKFASYCGLGDGTFMIGRLTARLCPIIRFLPQRRARLGIFPFSSVPPRKKCLFYVSRSYPRSWISVKYSGGISIRKKKRSRPV